MGPTALNRCGVWHMSTQHILGLDLGVYTTRISDATLLRSPSPQIAIITLPLHYRHHRKYSRASCTRLFSLVLLLTSPIVSYPISPLDSEIPGDDVPKATTGWAQVLHPATTQPTARPRATGLEAQQM
ncbi:hypothetical protein FRC08_000547 [Ceratobasidium sp. 394]|nr:hypothetical protein FRC08_000547 [Ceratobasidium sp. 394]